VASAEDNTQPDKFRKNFIRSLTILMSSGHKPVLTSSSWICGCRTIQLLFPVCSALPFLPERINIWMRIRSSSGFIRNSLRGKDGKRALHDFYLRSCHLDSAGPRLLLVVRFSKSFGGQHTPCLCHYISGRLHGCRGVDNSRGMGVATHRALSHQLRANAFRGTVSMQKEFAGFLCKESNIWLIR
jgi:hypothetical protein